MSQQLIFCLKTQFANNCFCVLAICVLFSGSQTSKQHTAHNSNATILCKPAFKTAKSQISVEKKKHTAAQPDQNSVNLSDLLHQLSNKDPKARMAALIVLAELRHNTQAIWIALTNTLKDQEAEIRQLALETLVSTGKDKQKVAQAIVPMLKEPNYDVRNATIQVLGELGRSAKSKSKSY